MLLADPMIIHDRDPVGYPRGSRHGKHDIMAVHPRHVSSMQSGAPLESWFAETYRPGGTRIKEEALSDLSIDRQSSAKAAARTRADDDVVGGVQTLEG